MSVALLAQAMRARDLAARAASVEERSGYLAQAEAAQQAAAEAAAQISADPAPPAAQPALSVASGIIGNRAATQARLNLIGRPLSQLP